MGTSCLIGLLKADGKIKSIKCNFDGYPMGVGRNLLRCCSNRSIIESTISLGNLMFLGPTLDPGTTVWNPTGGSPVDHPDIESYLRYAATIVQYVYLFDGTWKFTSISSVSWKILGELVSID